MKILDVLSVLLAVVLMAVWLVCAGVMMKDKHYLTILWQTLIAMLLAYGSADLASGIFHWLGDSVGSPGTPFLGKKFIAPFREHHDDPLAITQHNFWVTNGNIAAVLVLVLGPVSWVLIKYNAISYFLASFLFFFVLMIFFTNQVHQYAHLQKVPKWVRFLQRYRIILCPKHHALHHMPPHDCNFSITNGSADFLLNRVLRKQK